MQYMESKGYKRAQEDREEEKIPVKKFKSQCRIGKSILTRLKSQYRSSDMISN